MAIVAIVALVAIVVIVAAAVVVVMMIAAAVAAAIEVVVVGPFTHHAVPWVAHHGELGIAIPLSRWYLPRQLLVREVLPGGGLVGVVW